MSQTIYTAIHIGLPSDKKISAFENGLNQAHFTFCRLSMGDRISFTSLTSGKKKREYF